MRTLKDNELSVYINGVGYVVNRNDLYKTRDDNELSLQERIDKYEDRIVNGTIGDVERIESFDIDVNGKSYRGTRDAILDHVKGLLK